MRRRPILAAGCIALLAIGSTGAGQVAAIINPANEVVTRLFPIEAPPAAAQLGFQLGFQLDGIEARESEEIPAAVARAKKQGADALYVVGDPMFHSPPNRLPDLAAKVKLPAIYLPRVLVEAGGLMSYSPDFDAIARRGAHYVLKTAKTLGLDVPSSPLAGADEVIE